jgi:hypothetical protein
MRQQVTECIHRCRFFEEPMCCTHPTFDGGKAYSGCIISWDDRNGIPEKCPLRNEDLTYSLFTKEEAELIKTFKKEWRQK